MMKGRLFMYLLLAFTGVLHSCGDQSTNENDRKDSLSLRGDEVVTSESNNLDKIWMKYQFTENEVNTFSDMIEESLAEYLSMFPNYSDAEINSSISRLIKKSESNLSFFEFLKEHFSLYLYNPNSPLRNDSYYEKVLNTYQQSNVLSETEKQRDKIVLELVKKNQVGSKAANFDFLDKNGNKKQMYSLSGKYKLLVFYDPLCGHCKEVLSEMKESDIINSVIKEKLVTVLAIDPIGDLQEWEKYKTELPKHWENGFDDSGLILKRSKYNILAYPTIYLIDDNNNVVLKDVYLMDVEKHFIYN